MIFETIETHTLGEPTRIITSGFPKYNAHSMMEYKEYLEKNYDFYRSAIMCEPRGHRDMVGALLVAPISKKADIGVIYMDANRWINMCGHATIGVAMTLIHEKMVDVIEPVTKLTLETPAGLIDVEVKVKNKVIQNVSFVNIPSFLYLSDCSVELDEKKFDFAISYSGSFFALVETYEDIHLNSIKYFKDLGVRLLKQMNKKYDVKHPELSITKIANIEFYKKTSEGQKNIVVSEEGQIDRSPCGTGTCAKLAYMYSKNELKINEPFVNTSFTGVSFRGYVLKETKLADYQAIIPKITGMAYVDGYSKFVIDEKDPLKYGFNI